MTRQTGKRIPLMAISSEDCTQLWKESVFKDTSTETSETDV